MLLILKYGLWAILILLKVICVICDKLRTYPKSINPHHQHKACMSQYGDTTTLLQIMPFSATFFSSVFKCCLKLARL